jgi:hypothetical protein
VRFLHRAPAFNEVDGEYVVPIRMSEELLTNLIAGWHPLGFGWATLKGRPDDSYDLFIRQAGINADMNLVKLDLVQTAMMAALDLSRNVIEEENMVDEHTTRAAREVMRLVAAAAATE